MSSSGSPLTNFFQNSIVPPAPASGTQNTAGPLWLQDYLYNTLGAASNLATQPFPQFPGPLVAGPSQQTQQSWNLAGQNVGNYQPYMNVAAGLTNEVGQPINQSDISTFLNPFQDYITQALNRNLSENVLPQIQDKFVSMGQSRSPQEQEITSRAARDNQIAVGQSLAGGYQGALSDLLQQRGQQEAAGAQFGQLGALQSQLGLRDVGTLAASGQAQDALAQSNINAAYNQFENQAMWPYQQVGYLSDIARGLPVSAAGSTTTSAGTAYPGAYAYGPSPLSILAGASEQNAALGGSGTGIFARGGHVGPLTYAKGGHHRRRFGTGGFSGAPTSMPGPTNFGGEQAGPVQTFIDALPSWTNFIPGVGAVKGVNDLVTSSSPNYVGDVLSASSLLPGVGGLVSGALNTLAPGGALNTALFGTPEISPSSMPGASGSFVDPATGISQSISYQPGLGMAPTEGVLGSFGQDIGSGLNDVNTAIGSGLSDLGDFASGVAGDIGSGIGSAISGIGDFFGFGGDPQGGVGSGGMGGKYAEGGPVHHHFAYGGHMDGGSADDLDEGEEFGTNGSASSLGALARSLGGGTDEDGDLTHQQEDRAYGVMQQAARRSTPQGTVLERANMMKGTGIPPLGAYQRLVVPTHGPAYQHLARSPGYARGGALCYGR